jgi:ATP-dependent Lhr-like helicase
MLALTSGGAIPETADYRVLLEPEGTFIGTVNEDFAVESMAGDVFQLGNASWRMLRIQAGTVRVEDAHGEPPGIPFWLGEAPARSDELSAAVAELRHEVENRLDDRAAAEQWLSRELAGKTNGADRTDKGSAAGTGSSAASDSTVLSDSTAPTLTLGASLSDPTTSAAFQIIHYLADAHRILGVLPTQDTVIAERFFDQAGGMQLVIHAPFGSRINKAWGLSLRKRFCRSFNFELQAAATEDGIVAGAAAFIPARERLRFPPSGVGARSAGPGPAGRASVRHALALERQHLPGNSTLPGREEGSAPDSAHGSG